MWDHTYDATPAEVAREGLLFIQYLVLSGKGQA